MTPHRAALLAALTAAVLVATGCSSLQTTGSASTGASTSVSPTSTSAAAGTPTASRSSEPERSAPPVPTGVDPALAGVDRSSIDAVATAVVTAFTTANTATDTGPNNSVARTISLLTADYAAAIITTPPLRSPGARWNTWSAQGVRLTATVTPLADDRPVDTTSTATRIYLVTQTPTTRTGQVLDAVVTVAYVALRRDTSGWAVAQVEQR
jgi:hypothetical protein